MASPQSSQTLSSGNGVSHRVKEYGLNTPQGSPTSSSNGAPRRINEYDVLKVDGERELNLYRYFQLNNFIKISVGPNGVSWTLNKELACDRIPALKTAVQASPSNHEIVRLSLKEDPTIFAFIVDWALTLRLDVQLTHDFQNDTVDEEQLALLCGIYECSHRLEMNTLSLEVFNQMKRCLRHSRSLPNPKVLDFIYSNTAVDGPVQQVIGQEIVELFVKASTEEVSNKVLRWADITTSHRGLTVQFMLALKKRRDIAEPKTIEVHQAKKRKAANISGKHSHRPASQSPNTLVDLISSSSEG